MQKISLPFSAEADMLDIRLLTREDVVQSDDDIARLIGMQRTVSLQQVHGNQAVIIREPSSRVFEADAVATDLAELTLTIRFADCQGFVVFDPKSKVVALIHAGWKGMCRKIISSTFSLLLSEWNIEAKNVFVFAGPSLCKECAEFSDPLKEAPELAGFAHGRTIDLTAAADAEFYSLGVRADHLKRSLDCTRCHPEKYFTYRGGDRELVKSGYTNCFAVTMG